MALGTDETIIIDAENDLNLQENEELLDDDDEDEDEAKPPEGMSIAHKHLFKIGLYTFHLILKLVVNTVGLTKFRAKTVSSRNIIMIFLQKLSL